MEGADSAELNPETPYPVISLMEEQKKIQNMGGTMRLGSYPAVIEKGSKVAEVYGRTEVSERHRHRYEVNNHFLPKLEEAGLVIGGVSAGRERLVETIELPQHPWFFACQFHPEFTSTPRKGHPLFTAYIKAALANKKA